MTSIEKSEMLKNTIYKLYSKEGRSLSYISKLLDINRTTISKQIRNWNFEKAVHRRRLTPSNQKFANKNREYIISKLNKNESITKISKEIGVSRNYLQKTIIPNDNKLNNARNEYINRIKTKSQFQKMKKLEKSKLVYDFKDLPDEIWKPILGYTKYMVSNMGRIKRYAKKYNKYYLLSPYPNINNHRLYVKLSDGKKEKNLQVARLVAYSFVDGYSDINNTVNHKDGDVNNNKADNLEWISQAKNNLHSYRKLNRTKVNKRRYNFSKIIYKDKFEFNK